MDSSSLGASSGSDDSFHGLKFGKKIYFEDGASAVGGSSSSSSSMVPPSPAALAAAPQPAAKKGKASSQGGGQPQQPPRCQVEGCNADLSGTKAYYCRHKVCKMHSKEPKVIVAGLEQRFCQQCSRFHQLPEFDQGKRSCRRRLAGHNERRRKPPPGPFVSHYTRLVAPFHEEHNRYRSFQMDFNHPRVSGAAQDVWPTMRTGDRIPNGQWQGVLASPSAAAGTHPYLQGPSGVALYSAPEAPPGDCLAGVTDSSCALSLLSTQPWGSNATTNRTPISISSSFEGTPMVQQVISDNYMASPWGFRAHGGRANSHDIQHDIGLVPVPEATNAHFSGELELALQGNPQCLNHDSGHSGPGIHWSL